MAGTSPASRECAIVKPNAVLPFKSPRISRCRARGREESISNVYNRFGYDNVIRNLLLGLRWLFQVTVVSLLHF
jgi:hypothetical protein